MFISNPFKETSEQKQTPKGQNTLIFKLILNLLCLVSSILRSLWLLCQQCLMRPVVLFDYVICYEPNSRASHLASCGLARGEFAALRGCTVQTGDLGPAKHQHIRVPDHSFHEDSTA